MTLQEEVEHLSGRDVHLDPAVDEIQLKTSHPLFSLDEHTRSGCRYPHGGDRVKRPLVSFLVGSA
jgi:hypothetical protein